MKDDKEKKKAPLGSGRRFREVEEEARESGADDPAAVAAAAGRKKYGKKKMAELAARGRRRAAQGKSLGPPEASEWETSYNMRKLGIHNFLHTLWGQETKEKEKSYAKPKILRTGELADFVKEEHERIHKEFLSSPKLLREMETWGDLDETLPAGLAAAFMLLRAKSEEKTDDAAPALARALPSGLQRVQTALGIDLVDTCQPLVKSGRGNIDALRDWVGRVGFNEAVPKVMRALGVSEERAKKIVGKLKGMADRAGTLRKKHSYDPAERAAAKRRKSFQIVGYYQ